MDIKSYTVPDFDGLMNFVPCGRNDCMPCNSSLLIRHAIKEIHRLFLKWEHDGWTEKEVYLSLIHDTFGGPAANTKEAASNGWMAHGKDGARRGPLSKEEIKKSFVDFMTNEGYRVVDDGGFVMVGGAQKEDKAVKEDEPEEGEDISTELLTVTSEVMTTLHTLVSRLSDANMANESNAASGWRALAHLGRALANIEDARELVMQ